MRLIISCFTLAASAMPLYAVVLGQIDTFQGGLQGWTADAQPVTLGTPGLAGGTDIYLLVISNGGTGPGRLLNADSPAHWGGNYVEAGVTGIAADLKNFGPETLQMRLFFAGNYGDYVSSTPVLVPPDGQWHHVVFGLTAADLTWGGTGGSGANLTDALRFMGGFFLRHQSGPPVGLGGGTPIASAIGLDNVQAVPEPGTAVLFLSAALSAVRGSAPKGCNNHSS